MHIRRVVQIAAIVLMGIAGPVSAKAPAWLHELADEPLPSQLPETQAVQLLSEVELVVDKDGRMRKRVRGAVRILRPEGVARAVLRAPQDTWMSVKDMHGWMIPASGKDLELRFKDAVETSVVDVAGSEVITDLRMRLLGFSGAGPGAVVGFEYEIDQNPLQMADIFAFQDTIPVREANYTLKLPPGWNMVPSWLNHPAIPPQSAGAQQWRWTMRDIPPVALETYMPAWQSVAGHLFVAVSPPDKVPQLSSWAGIGGWFEELAKERRVASDAIRSKVAELVAGKASNLEKMRALASFVQSDVRYVGIQLGIGGFQPHAAADIFLHRYGDCKDKATLLGVMLREIGISSVVSLVNTERLHVRLNTPPSLQFNHVILAIRLPRDLQDSSLLSAADLPDGRLLFFDPTDELTPFGRIRGQLQGSVGLLALAEGSRLITLPKLPPDQSGNRRTAKLVLNEQGVLTGEIKERITGQEALMQRGFLRSSTRESDVTKVVEARLAESLASFQLSAAMPRNRDASELPLEWDYRFSAASYARRSGDLMLVRPRVLGVHAFILPEDKPRVHDLMLSEPRLHQDEVLIDLPVGYIVESLPPPVEVDTGFAIYRSRSEVTGSQLKYTRSYEVRDLLVPAAKIEDFRRLHREISRDERAVVVLKKAGS
jgi:hypothetical protein